MVKKFLPVLFFVAVFLLSSCAVRYSTLSSLSTASDEVAFQSVAGDPFFKEHYLVWFEQPIDHANPRAGTFKQRVWLSHKHVSAPVVMVTEGYSAPALYKSELADLLNANQIVVEHRFFGASVPEGMPWQHLTIEQAANDHQQILKYFQQLYKGSWVTTGISKGGQAAIIHRALYPKQVDATVTYVAPYNLEKEDSRLIAFFETVGTEEDRRKIRHFQLEILKRRQEIMPHFEDWVTAKGLSFSMDLDQVFELSVLEYPFSLWQWCVPLEEIPPSNATSQVLFDHLYRGIDFSYFSEQEAIATGPFFYQAYTQLGYYAYDASHLRDYLTYFNTDFVSNELMVPSVGFTPVFDISGIDRVTRALQKADARMLHIVGANDPWSATTPDISGLKNSILIVDPQGCHLTRINNLPDDLKQKVKRILAEWVE
ncbi:MAG: aminopeptidase [Bacteroidales bacterium]|nr:aminopeptidase [Bacteroidales bacterium]